MVALLFLLFLLSSYGVSAVDEEVGFWGYVSKIVQTFIYDMDADLHAKRVDFLVDTKSYTSDVDKVAILQKITRASGNKFDMVVSIQKEDNSIVKRLVSYYFDEDGNLQNRISNIEPEDDPEHYQTMVLARLWRLSLVLWTRYN